MPTQGRPPSPSGPVASSDVTEHATYVTFRLAQHHYALPLSQVERAVRMVALTPLPEAPAWVAGIMNLHGLMIPVIDMRRRLGYPPNAQVLDSHILVARAAGCRLGLIVDQVTGVLEVPMSGLKPPPDVLPVTAPLAAVAQQGHQVVLVLDAARLLPPERIAEGDANHEETPLAREIARKVQQGTGRHVQEPVTAATS